MNLYLSGLIEISLTALEQASCVEIDEDDFNMKPTPFGTLASHYYLKYTTVKVFKDRLTRQYQATPTPANPHGEFPKLLRILSDAREYEDLPVRHNEDVVNRDFEMKMAVPINSKSDSLLDDQILAGKYSFESPHVKTFLLLQAHLARTTVLPVIEYLSDTVSVLDQAIRCVQAMIDCAVIKGFATLTGGLVTLLQCIKQAMWPTESPLLQLPYVDGAMVARVPVKNFDKIRGKSKDVIGRWVNTSFPTFSKEQALFCASVACSLPFLGDVSITIPNAKEKEGRWYVEQDVLYTIQISVIRAPSVQRRRTGKTDFGVHAPRFPKHQQEGWMLLFSDGDQLHALKRLSPSSEGTIKTSVQYSWKNMNMGEKDFSLCLMSDCYVGLDLAIPFRVTIL